MKSQNQKPPQVAEVEEFWTSEPPERSDRCKWWVRRFAEGFTPNKRISKMGYHERAEFYGVYIWELLNVLRPLEHGMAPVFAAASPEEVEELRQALSRPSNGYLSPGEEKFPLLKETVSPGDGGTK